MTSQAIKDAFARELSDALDNSGYTVTEVAQEIEVWYPTVTSYLRGEKFPNRRVFKNLVDLFGDVWIYTSREDCLRMLGEE
jgi:hypothetical protein